MDDQLRKRDFLTINGKEFVIRELTIGEIIELFKDSAIINEVKNFEENMEQMIIGSISQDIHKLIEKSCTFKMEDMKELTPTQFLIICEKFKEVNKSFFDILKATGITKFLEDFHQVLLLRFSKRVATL